MARATTTTQAATDLPRDAVALLKQDHRTVDSLFREFEHADESELSGIAEKICQLLNVHTQIEEEILYPAAREALADDEEESELVHEAQVEHNSAKELIAKIEAMASEDERYQATVSVLGEYVRHHVKEEESQLFPALKRAKVDMKELGSQLASRKVSLMEEMGIPPVEAAAPRKRVAGAVRAKAAARSRGRQARAGARSKGTRSGAGRTARH